MLILSSNRQRILLRFHPGLYICRTLSKENQTFGGGWHVFLLPIDARNRLTFHQACLMSTVGSSIRSSSSHPTSTQIKCSTTSSNTVSLPARKIAISGIQARPKFDKRSSISIKAYIKRQSRSVQRDRWTGHSFACTCGTLSSPHTAVGMVEAAWPNSCLFLRMINSPF